MSVELIMELIYTIISGVAFVVGAHLYLHKGNPLYAQMVVCMIGCRFLQGFFETLLVWDGDDLETLTIAGLGQLAQFLFLISANYGAIDSLCDDGSRQYLKYRVIAGVIPLAVVIYFFIIAPEVTDTPLGMAMMLVAVVILITAFYYHLKHLIIKDVDGGFVKNLRIYNFLGVVNCVAFSLEWFSLVGTPRWFIAFILYDIVTIGFVPALWYAIKPYSYWMKHIDDDIATD